MMNSLAKVSLSDLSVIVVFLTLVIFFLAEASNASKLLS